MSDAASPGPVASPPPFAPERRDVQTGDHEWWWQAVERNWLATLLVFACASALFYFFAVDKVFIAGTKAALIWAREAWNPENNQEHSYAVLPIFFFLLWWHRRSLAAAQSEISWTGFAWVIAGILTFLLSARCLQPRLALVALPMLVYGCARFVWGREVGRLFAFPCLFLLFTIPIGGIVQGTVSLQILVSSVVKMLVGLVGVHVQTIGTQVIAADKSFNFEIAEGCSGIRSLMAMTMLAALYVHFTQRQTWKKWVIFASSLLFALVGNIGRITTVILVARFINPTLAGGKYHDASDFIFFPVAVLAMVMFSRLLDGKWWHVAQKQPRPPSPPSDPRGRISYDY